MINRITVERNYWKAKVEAVRDGRMFIRNERYERRKNYPHKPTSIAFVGNFDEIIRGIHCYINNSLYICPVKLKHFSYEHQEHLRYSNKPD